MSKPGESKVERGAPVRGEDGTDEHARRLPDTKQRTIEHGAEEYYRREGSAAEHERAGQPLTGGDAEAGDREQDANRDRGI